MRILPRSASLACALAISVLIFAAAPVGAVDGADFLAWQWQAPGARGLGLIKTGPGTMQVEVIGLGANSTVGVVLNSVGCGKQSKPSNTLASYGLQATAQGAGYLSVELETVSFGIIKSVRLFNGNTQLDCDKPTSYQVGGNPESRPIEQMSLNFLNRNGMHLAIALENDEVHWVGHGFLSQTEFEMLATHSKCPNQPSGFELENVWVTSAKGTAYGTMSIDVEPWDTRAFQLFRGSTRIMCGKAIHMDLL
jgi:hypothetical protein